MTNLLHAELNANSRQNTHDSPKVKLACADSEVSLINGNSADKDKDRRTGRWAPLKPTGWEGLKPLPLLQVLITACMNHNTNGREREKHSNKTMHFADFQKNAKSLLKTG